MVKAVGQVTVQGSRFFQTAFQAMLAGFTLTALLVVFHALAQQPDAPPRSVSGIATASVVRELSAEPNGSDVVEPGRAEVTAGSFVAAERAPDPPVTVLDSPAADPEPAFHGDTRDDPFFSSEEHEEPVSSRHVNEQQLCNFEPLFLETDAKLTRIETQLAEIDGRISELSQTSSSQQAQLLLRTGELLEALKPRTGGDFSAAEPSQQGRPVFQQASLPTNESPFDPQQEHETVSGAGEQADAVPDAPEDQPTLRITPSETEPDNYSLEIHNAEISEVLQTLGQLEGLNVLVGRGVEGTVTANLQNVTIRKAIDAILESHGYVVQQEEGLVYAVTDAVAQAQQQVRRRPAARTYRPGYVDVRKLRSAIEPLLTEGIGSAVVTEPGHPEAIVADGQQPPSGATLLVRDYDDVLDEINRIVAEMDVPPKQIVIDTMVLKVTLRDGIRLGVNSSLFDRVYRQMLVAEPDSGLAESHRRDSESASGPPEFAEPRQEVGGLKHGVLQGERRTFLEALKSIGQVHLITSTQLPVLDRHEGLLTLGHRFELPDGHRSNAAATFHNAETSLRLAVRPSIAPGGLIRLDIRPEQYRSGGSSPTVAGELAATGLSASSIVREGSTVVVGGLYNDRLELTQKRNSVWEALPWMKSRQQPARIVRDELVLLLTPRIVADPTPVPSRTAGTTTSR